jgi:hypothetical protein
LAVVLVWRHRAAPSSHLSALAILIAALVNSSRSAITPTR